MKTFPTVADLWDYFVTCPLCKNPRDVDITVGPDYVFHLVSFNKTNDILTIQYDTTASQREGPYNRKLLFTTRINCKNNTIESNSGENRKRFWEAANLKKEYFYLFAACDCGITKHITNCNSGDIWIDPDQNTIDNIGVDEETVILFPYGDNIGKYIVDFYYDSFNGQAVISHDKPGGKSSSLKESICPMFSLDNMDEDKLLNKIKTILTFS